MAVLPYLIALQVLMALMFLLVILLLVQRIERMSALMADALSDLETAHIRQSETNHAVGRIFILLSPLLEQTDWMTGRWGGRLGELISLEKARNATTVAIRARLFSTPFMQDFFSENKTGLLKGSLQAGFTGMENERKDV